MKNRSLVGCAAGVLVLALLAGCKRPPTAFAPPPPPEVTVANPVEQQIPDTIEFTGTTRGVNSVEIRARVRGFIEKKLVDNGRRVKAGELLFVIDPRTFDAEVRQAQAEVSARQSDLKLAEITLERVTQASASSAVAQLEVDRAQAQRDGAAAQLELAKARLTSAELNLEFSQVKSPIDGRVGFVDVEVGDLVGASEPTLLAQVIDDSKVYATYEIDERTVQRLLAAHQNRRPGEDGREGLEVRLAQANDVGFPHTGYFHSADNTVNPRTGTVKVEAMFDNPEGKILPGSFVRVQPQWGMKDATLIPQSAVLQDQAGRFVLSVNDQNKVERIAVKVQGAAYRRMLPVMEDFGEPIPGAPEPVARLTAATRVIVNGIQRARPGVEVKPTLATPAAGAVGGSGG
ncbi:MAG TPA: efflux RND transporter periplasmic adaptor subunit [Phycisphaerales bacterium]|nr:efflux RND transporter periplasmic adaptor subunit [Phycisphaerales bacterium]